MKANLTNLRKALKACAKAHNVEYHWWRDDQQITLQSESVPVVSDVRQIVEAFYGSASGIVEVNYGYTIVWEDIFMNTKDEVNEQLLYLALPYGTVL